MMGAVHRGGCCAALLASATLIVVHVSFLQCVNIGSQFRRCDYSSRYYVAVVSWGRILCVWLLTQAVVGACQCTPSDK